MRTPANATKLAELAATRTNVTVVKGDLVDPTSLKVSPSYHIHSALLISSLTGSLFRRKAAAAEGGRKTGGKLDYLINNGAALSLAGGLTD